METSGKISGRAERRTPPFGFEGDEAMGVPRKEKNVKNLGQAEGRENGETGRNLIGKTEERTQRFRPNRGSGRAGLPTFGGLDNAIPEKREKFFPFSGIREIDRWAGLRNSRGCSPIGSLYPRRLSKSRSGGRRARASRRIRNRLSVRSADDRTGSFRAPRARAVPSVPPFEGMDSTTTL